MGPPKGSSSHDHFLSEGCQKGDSRCRCQKSETLLLWALANNICLRCHFWSTLVGVTCIAQVFNAHVALCIDEPLAAMATSQRQYLTAAADPEFDAATKRIQRHAEDKFELQYEANEKVGTFLSRVFSSNVIHEKPFCRVPDTRAGKNIKH